MKNENDEISILMVKMDSRMSLIEVKGDSVEHLLTARIMLKTLKEEYEKLKNKIEEEENAV